MVHVVRTLPPADGQATAEVGDECANQCIRNKVASDSSVASIMSCEHDLLLKYS
jgi:hypothetical protein